MVGGFLISDDFLRARFFEPCRRGLPWAWSVIRKKPASDLIRGRYRFSAGDHAPTTSWSGTTICRKVLPL
jgi:hypothetical protein